jgi:NADPH:quinone reductase-like Zn-dependent oxidoreductase
MQATVIRRFGGPENLEVVDLPIPEPGSGQVRIKVAASTVNPIDVSLREGNLLGAGLLPARESYGLGFDIAGVVDTNGLGADRLRPGDQVIALHDFLFPPLGAHAEYVVADESWVAPAPRSVPLETAATLPLNALTADRALRLADLHPGQTLLVTGAAGGVGGFVVELARLRGLRTIALASAQDEGLLRSLGASEFVARSEDFAAAVRELMPGGVDAVIDTAVLGIAAHQALRPQGTFIAPVRPFAPPPIRGTHVIVLEAFSDGARLSELAGLVDQGRLSLRVAATYPLRDAAEAHARFSAGGLRGGRVVLAMP